MTTTQNRDKFATYHRDSTGLDYALNRYYSSQHGRFLTPDPFSDAGRFRNPQSLNRYAYPYDPVNLYDPTGLQAVWVNEYPPPSLPSSASWWGGGGGGASDLMEVVLSTDEGGGGGGGSEREVVDDMEFVGVSTSGRNQDLIRSMIARLRTDIDPDCQVWLESGPVYKDFGKYLDQVSPYIGHAESIRDRKDPKSVVNAVTGSGAGGLVIVINAQGTFFSGNVDTNDGAIKGGTDRARAFILLHEFSHSTEVPGVVPDRGNAAAGQTNNRAVTQNCEKTLKKFN